MNFTLYHLSHQYHELLQWAADGETEAMKDTLEAIKEPLEDKAEAIGKIILSMNGEAEAIKAEEKRLEARRKSLETKADGLKQYLFENMETAGMDSVRRPLVSISIQKNPHSVKVLDEKKVPADYIVTKTTTALDKKNILSALKEGLEIQGVEIQQTKRINIK